ncbi:MAG: DUF5660 domain-containing protein [Candidatus Woesebacteria bacterium]|nr:DUF5660 domain-containing protein [Candidatus Woesebacteria bacterium]
MDHKNQKTKKNKPVEVNNFFETIKEETKATSDEFFKQLLGQQRQLQQDRSGELPMGQSIQMSEVLSGQMEKNKQLEENIFFERRLFNEEKQESGNKLNELRVRLQAIQTEASKMVATTANLTQELKTAVMQGATSASEYQINFYEDIIQLIVSFRKKIDSAIVWMQGSNKRAGKKNFWSQYKKKGSSFLLSGESYIQRSAG